MKNLGNEKGITLVALVVTIIVLLILAGVSLSLVAGGNGIIDQSVTAVDTTKEGAAKEQAELKIAEAVAEYYEAKYVTNTAGSNSLVTYVKSKVDGVSLEDGTLAMSGTTVTLTVEDKTFTASFDSENKLGDWTKK